MISVSPHIFESVMLVCFGCSWPFAIAKTIRTKNVEGKSIIFVSLIFVGYLAGIVFKLAGQLDGVIWLYVTNGSMVFAEIVLYFKYKRPVVFQNKGGLLWPLSQFLEGRSAKVWRLQKKSPID